MDTDGNENKLVQAIELANGFARQMSSGWGEREVFLREFLAKYPSPLAEDEVLRDVFVRTMMLNQRGETQQGANVDEQEVLRSIHLNLVHEKCKTYDQVRNVLTFVSVLMHELSFLNVLDHREQKKVLAAIRDVQHSGLHKQQGTSQAKSFENDSEDHLSSDLGDSPPIERKPTRSNHADSAIEQCEGDNDTPGPSQTDRLNRSLLQAFATVSIPDQFLEAQREAQRRIEEEDENHH